MLPRPLIVKPPPPFVVIAVVGTMTFAPANLASCDNVGLKVGINVPSAAPDAVCAGARGALRIKIHTYNNAAIVRKKRSSGVSHVGELSALCINGLRFYSHRPDNKHCGSNQGVNLSALGNDHQVFPMSPTC
jgi:hypothetical protein